MKNKTISATLTALTISLGTTLILDAQAPAPIDSNPSVASGEVHFHGLDSPHAVISQDSAKAIVDYSHFNVLPGGSVEFIQPGPDAAILNRITGNVPSTIDGLITANGQVYFVNPAGVTFGEGSIIRADTFLAAAGDLANEDFLSGSMDFTLSGTVSNAGIIEGTKAVSLLGKQIRNTGEIISREGIVVLSSGDRIYLQPVGSSLVVEVSTDEGAQTDGIGIDNSGSVMAQEILFSAGDAYALALSHSGSTKAAQSSKLYSDGGAIEIAGSVVVHGGTVEVGGTNRGGSSAPRASTTYITETGLIDVSSKDSGDGGKAVIWADEKTTFLGTVRGEGKDWGTGASLEISAAQLDMGDGMWNIFLGQGGKLLFDPLNVTIDATAATNIANQMNNGTAVTVDTNNAPFGGAGTEDGDIIVDAQIQVTNTANQGTLELSAARDIIINQRITNLQPVAKDLRVFGFYATRNIQVNDLIQSALLSTSEVSFSTVDGSISLSGRGAIDAGGSSIFINSGGDFTMLSGSQILSGINTSVDNTIEIMADGTASFTGGLVQTFGETLTDLRASRFLNSTGRNVFTSIGGAGYWQVALPHPYGETATTNPHNYGGLVSTNQAWYGAGVPSEFGRNSYGFYFQPVIDVVVNNDTKTYGEQSAMDFAGVTVDPSGLIDAATYGNVFAQDTVETISLGTPNFTSTGAAPTVAAGSYTIKASRESSIAGYIPNYVSGTLTVSPRPVTLSTPSQNKTYGDILTLDSTSFTVLDVDGDAVLPNGELIDTATLASAIGVDASTTASAGTYVDEIAITGQSGSNGFDTANYDFTYVAADLVVDRRPVTLTADSQSKTYGDVIAFDNTAFTVLDFDGDAVLPNGELIDTATLASATGVDASTTASAGTYVDEIAITGQSGSNGFDTANYDFTYVAADLVVDRRPVTLTADSQSKTYGDVIAFDNTAFTVLDFDGDAVLPNGELIDTATLASATGVDASTTASAGTYVDEIAITGQSGSNGFDTANYDFTYVAADLVVDRRPVTLTADSQSKTYGDRLSADDTDFNHVISQNSIAFTILDADGDSTLPNGETIETSLLLSLNGIGKSTTASVGTYVGEVVIDGVTSANGFENSNYQLFFVAGDLVVTPRPVTLTAETQGKAYGDALILDNTAFTVLDFDGDAVLPNGELIDTATLASATGVDASTTASAGTYVDEIAITGQSGSNGFDTANYDFTYVAADLVVDRRPVVLAAADQERTFYQAMDMDQTAFTITDTDGDAVLPNGELIDSVILASKDGIAGNADALPGVYTDNLTITGQSGSNGFTAGNYFLSYTPGNFSIKGPLAPPLLIEEPFPGFPDEVLGLSDANPRSNSVTFVPSAPLLTLFDDPDWILSRYQEKAQ